MRRICVTETNTRNLERVLYLCLTFTFSNMQKGAQRLMHTMNKYRSSGLLVKSSTNSDARQMNKKRTDQNDSFFSALDVRDCKFDWALTYSHAVHRLAICWPKTFDNLVIYYDISYSSNMLLISRRTILDFVAVVLCV